MNVKKLTVPLRIKTRDEIVDGKRVTEFADKSFELDVTLNAQMRWEQKFPAQAEKEELTIYAERIEKIGVHTTGGGISSAALIAKMKVLYCYFNFDFSFADFLAMFDFTLPEYAKTLIEQIKNAFEIINEAASEKN